MSAFVGRGQTAARNLLHAWIRSGAMPAPGDLDQGQEIVDEAIVQGLAGLVAGAVEVGAWPPQLIARLHAQRQAALFTAVQQLDTLAWAADRLERHGLRSLPLKGAAVAEDLYASPGERPMSDVDLLALDDFAGGCRLLQAEGFQVLDRADHAVALRAPAGVVLELHESVTSCPGLFALDGEALWARRRVGGGQVRQLPAREDLLVQLALHAVFQHGLDLRLVQYLDFRRLLAGPLDADLVLAITFGMHAGAVLGAALLAAEAVAGAVVPQALRAVTDVLPSGDRLRLDAWCAGAAAGALPPPLVRVRWMAARGRRLALVRGTLGGRAGGMVPRALRLLRRWGLPTLRSWRPARRTPA